MKIRMNPELAAVRGGVVRGKLFGEPVDSDGEYTVNEGQWKQLKGLTATAAGRTLPVWVKLPTKKEA